MTKEEQIRTNCKFCGYKCGLIATVKDNRVVSVEPDLTQFPYDENIYRGCRRWRLAVDVLDHPQRINYPLKRSGPRGSGQWERITWDQALDEIAAKLRSLKEQYGPEMLASSIGGPNATYWPLHRFMNLFGSPNNMGIGQICWDPGIFVNTLTYGWPIGMELNPALTKCAIIWGSNPAESDNSLLWRNILKFSRQNQPLLVIDPRRTRTAKRAGLWLAPRPGTDPYLALGFLHVIICEQRYDITFVNNWCHGFEQLCEHVKKFTPAYTEKHTGVKANDVIQAARLYAQHSPATIITGRGIDQLGTNTFATHRSIAILRAITGNIDVPGASHIHDMPDFIPELDLELSEKLPASVHQKQLGKNEIFLQSYPGYERMRELTLKHGKRLPMRYLTSAHPNLVWRAMLTGKPYPIRSLIVMATNPLVTHANTRLIYQALQSLDLLVVLELFQTPTSMLADYVLPIAGALERPVFETQAGTANLAYGGQQAVSPYYERRTDFDVFRELGLRLGQKNDWPWKTFRESLEYCLTPTGVTWEEFCQTGRYGQANKYHKAEEIEPQTGKPQGYATASGKVEIYSELLADMGYEALPEPKPITEPEKDFPLQLITGARFQPYWASSHRQLQSLRDVHPEPWAEMSSKTAAKLGINDGCPVWVETAQGKARFTLKIVEMRDDVVSIEYGWWYPEMEACEPTLAGVWVSNANILTSGDFKTSDPAIGTWTYNGLPCRVRPIK